MLHALLAREDTPFKRSIVVTQLAIVRHFINEVAQSTDVQLELVSVF